MLWASNSNLPNDSNTDFLFPLEPWLCTSLFFFFARLISSSFPPATFYLLPFLPWHIPFICKFVLFRSYVCATVLVKQCNILLCRGFAVLKRLIAYLIRDAASVDNQTAL